MKATRMAPWTAWIVGVGVLTASCGHAAPPGTNGMRPASAIAPVAMSSPATGRSAPSPPSGRSAKGPVAESSAPGTRLTLRWVAPPAPWRVAAGDACAGMGAEHLSSVTVAVPLVDEAASRASRVWHCGVGVVTGGEWRVAALPPQDTPVIAQRLAGGALAVGLRVPPAPSGTTTSGAPLLVYRGGKWIHVGLPHGQVVESLTALPGGGYAAGTAAVAAQDRCAVASCILGRIGVNTAGQWRWFVPPRPAHLAANAVYGMVGTADIAGGVQVGTLQGQNLWFGVNGIGVAALDLQSGWFDFRPGGHGMHYYPGSEGPVQVLGTFGTTVYYGVHRLAGAADAGYWGALNWVSDGSASFETAWPVPRGTGPAALGCLQGGVGAPRAVHVIAGRIWVQWSGCQVYEARVGAARLQRPDPPQCSGPSRIGVAYVGSLVSEVCVTKSGTTEIQFAGGTATVLHRYAWTGPALWRGYGPIPWYPGAGGSFWTWTAVGNGRDARLLEVSPAGRVLEQGSFPRGLVSGVAGPAHLWLVMPRGVAGVPLRGSIQP